jgi:hypothetical protein
MRILAFIFLTLNSSLVVISQNKNCDCYVKTDASTLDTKLLIADLKQKPPAEAPKPYSYLYPEKTQNEATHKILKDSATTWFIQPHVNAKSKYQTISIKKIMVTFYLPINFNKSDSIPVYAQPDRKSTIIHYIKSPIDKTERKTYWFVGCKPGAVKILLLEKQSQSGWIMKENYLHE